MLYCLDFPFTFQIIIFSSFLEDNIEENLQENLNGSAEGLQDISGFVDGPDEPGGPDGGGEDPPLYEGAPLSVAESAYSIMSFF